MDAPHQDGSDNTAINAVRLYCSEAQSLRLDRISSYDGLHGELNTGALCPDDYFMVAFMLRVQGCILIVFHLQI